MGVANWPHTHAISTVKLNLFGISIENAYAFLTLSAALNAVMKSQNAPTGYNTMKKLYFRCDTNYPIRPSLSNPKHLKKKNG